MDSAGGVGSLMMARPWRLHVCALLGYLLVAVMFVWPLPRHLQTHLPGSPDGDTGVYVWNLWVFQHEALEHRTLPYFTDTIFHSTGRANLSLHNYTAFANVLALPFVRRFGVVPTFNAVYVCLTLLTAYAMFLLARRLSHGDAWAAWLAGVVFAWSPVLITRGMGHYSLVAAAPLPIFVLLLLRVRDQPSLRDAIGLGITIAWATACDMYYGVYCLMLAAGYLIALVVRVHRLPSPVPGRLFARALDILAICVAGLAAALLVRHGWQFAFLGRAVQVRTVYNPLLVLTALVALRIGLHYRPTIGPVTGRQLTRIFRVTAAAGLVSALLMSPLLYTAGQQFKANGLVHPKIFWRSSPPGVDLLAWVVPNPNHPLAPPALREWVSRLTRAGYLENVASVPLVALAVMTFAVALGWRAPPISVAIAVGFGLLALGPFIRIAGIDTHVPAPWAVLRYAPIVELARSPSRFSVFAMLGVAAVFAGALHAVLMRWPTARGRVLALVTILLFTELLPAPRILYSAEIPSIYRTIARDPREHVSVLELPFGMRDGTMAVGNFTARTQFYQTAHGKPILGGYLSRLSRRRIADTRRDPVLNALISLSEGHRLSPDQAEMVRLRWQDFARRASIAYVVVDETRATHDLRSLVVTTLRLSELGSDGPLHLYSP